MQFMTVQIRSVYGSDRVYPMDETAVLFARLVGAKSFNVDQLRGIKALGYEIRVAAGTLPFAL